MFMSVVFDIRIRATVANGETRNQGKLTKKMYEQKIVTFTFAISHMPKTNKLHAANAVAAAAAAAAAPRSHAEPELNERAALDVAIFAPHDSVVREAHRATRANSVAVRLR